MSRFPAIVLFSMAALNSTLALAAKDPCVDATRDAAVADLQNRSEYKDRDPSHHYASEVRSANSERQKDGSYAVVIEYALAPEDSGETSEAYYSVAAEKKSSKECAVGEVTYQDGGS